MDQSWDKHSASLIAHLAISPEVRRLHGLAGNADALEPDMASAILAEASRFAAEKLAPVDKDIDSGGCALEAGRIRLAVSHQQAWTQYCAGGWVAIDAPERFGGQGLPLCLASAAQEIFDRGSVSFGMLPGAIRGAIKLLHSHGEAALAECWIPKLVSGKWGATICISEAEAGSDVGRIRTRAVRNPAGRWKVTGEKMWTSYGDHQLTKRIGHFALARAEGDRAGTRGLSLFLIPNVDDQGASNGVFVRGLEHKLGLHGSPTCAMGFEDANAILIGERGRGLPQLFSMIVRMRLNVCCQGLGLATDCYETAMRYAVERRQGGHPDAPPVPIIEHADIRAQLLEMAGEIETLRALNIAAAALADLNEASPEPAEREEAGALLGFLLPILKNGGAECGFDVSARAMLVLGGAGYTTDWPIERHMRDARVLAIFEGTTGMQAVDLVRRQTLGVRKGYEAFLLAMRRECDRLDADLAGVTEALYNAFESAVDWLADPARSALDIEAGSRPAMALATRAAQGWMAARLVNQKEEGTAALRLARLGRHWLLGMDGEAERLAKAVYAAGARLSDYAQSERRS